MKDLDHHTFTWICLGSATVGFFIGAAVYNIQPTFLSGELAVYVSLAGASTFLFASIPRIHKLFDSITSALLRSEGVGLVGCMLSTVGFTILAYSGGSDEGAHIALAGFYFLAYWMVHMSVHGLNHAPWPKAISYAGIAAAIPMVITALGQHLVDSTVMAVGAVLSMGLVPLWLAGLTTWLMFHDMRARAMKGVDSEQEV